MFDLRKYVSTGAYMSWQIPEVISRLSDANCTFYISNKKYLRNTMYISVTNSTKKLNIE